MNKRIKIGIDIGGTNTKIGIVDSNNNILSTNIIKTHAENDVDFVINEIINGTNYLLNHYNFDFSDCEYIGIGCPGTVNTEKGIVIYANNLNWVNVDIASIFNQKTSLPVYVDNDANCAALGEYYAGSSKGTNSSVFITIGTGIGSGVILNGSLIKNGGELGHLLYEKNGIMCTCGRRGCYEAYASASALKNNTLKIIESKKDSYLFKLCNNNYDNLSAKIPFKAMRDNDQDGIKLIDDFIDALGNLIVDAINAFQPDIILIGGGVSAEGNDLTSRLYDFARKYAYGCEFSKIPKIIPAQLGNRAGMIGAASLGKE